MGLLIFPHPNATQEEIASFASQVSEQGSSVVRFQGQSGLVLYAFPAVNGESEYVRSRAGDWRVEKAEHPYIFSSRQAQPESSVVDLGDGVKIGDGSLAIFAGPCAIEHEDQVMTVAKALADAGVSILRGGLFKPRTSPFSFQGLEGDGVALMNRVREATGLKFVTEAVDEQSLEMIDEHADMIQIGARNMHNFALLKKVGKANSPVLLKRGFSATMDDLLTAADYILSGGNTQVVLCERGIRTFTTHSRNTLDLNIVPALRERTHLPVIVDPSHGCGNAAYVPDLALASVAVGADGVMVEVHGRPEEALSDGQQSLSLPAFASMMQRVERVATAIDRPLALATPSA